MNEKTIKIIGYTLFTIGVLVFGKLSLDALDWYGVDIPGIEYAEEKAADIDWMLEQVESGAMAGPVFQSYEREIESLKKNKLIFSLAGFFACIAGLIFVKMRKQAVRT